MTKDHKHHPALALKAGFILLFSAHLAFGQAYSLFPDLQLYVSEINPETGEVTAVDSLPSPVTDASLTLEEDIARYESSLAETEATSGAFDRSPLEQLESLGLLYQQAGQHEEAIEALLQAHQLTRIHHGLDAIDQAPLLEAVIQSQRALEEYEDADDMEAALFYLALSRRKDDPAAYTAAELRWADWNVSYFLDHYLYQYKSLEDDYTVSLAGGISSAGFTSFTTTQSLISVTGMQPDSALPLRTGRYLSRQTKRLNTAEDIYTALLEETDDPALAAELRHKLTALGYYRNHEVGMMLEHIPMDEFNRVTYRDADHISRNSYREGSALLSARTLASASQALSPAHITDRLNLADWYLLYGHTQKANTAYLSLYEDLVAAGWDETMIQKAMNPQPAVMLPAFIDHQYVPAELFDSGILTSGTQSTQTSGYVDLELVLKRNGSVQTVRTLDYSANNPARLRRTLHDYLESRVFRPVFVNGESIKQSVQLRYNYNY